MPKSLLQPIASIRLTDALFAAKLTGKYGWSVDYSSKRSSLKHVEKGKRAKQLGDVKPPTIHITKVIRPLYLKLIYENHQLNQLIQYKQTSLSVSQSGQQQSTSNEIKKTTLLEKVTQYDNQRIDKQNLQRILKQVEHKIVNASEPIERMEFQQRLGTYQQPKAGPTMNHHHDLEKNSKLIRRPATVNGNSQLSKITSETLGIKVQRSTPRTEVKSLYHVQKEKPEKKAKATMKLSQYVQKIMTQELEEKISTLPINRTRANLHVKKHDQSIVEQTSSQKLKPQLKELEQKLIDQENKLKINQSQIELTLDRASVVAQHMSQRQQLNNDTKTKLPFTTKMASQLKYYIKAPVAHVHEIRMLQQQSIQAKHIIVFVPEKQFKEATSNQKARLIHRALKPDENQHLYNKSTRVNAQGERLRTELVNSINSIQQKVTEQNQSTNEKQHFQNQGNEQVSIGVLQSLKQRKAALQHSEVSKQLRLMIASKSQVMMITKLHQELADRQIQVVSKREMVQKKKTPRSKKMITVPEVMLFYRIGSGESVKASQQESVHTILTQVRAITKGGLGKRSLIKKVHSAQKAQIEVQQLRRQAQLIYHTSMKEKTRTIKSVSTTPLNKVITTNNEQFTQQRQNDTVQLSLGAQQLVQRNQSADKKQNHDSKQPSSETLLLAQQQIITAKLGFKRVQNEEFIRIRQMSKVAGERLLPHFQKQGRASHVIAEQLKVIRIVPKPQLHSIKLLHRRLTQIQAKTILLPNQTLLQSHASSQQSESKLKLKGSEVKKQNTTKLPVHEQQVSSLTASIIKQQEIKQPSEIETKKITRHQLIYRTENQSVQLKLLIEQLQQGHSTQTQVRAIEQNIKKQEAKQANLIASKAKTVMTEQMIRQQRMMTNQHIDLRKSASSTKEAVVLQQRSSQLGGQQGSTELIVHRSEIGTVESLTSVVNHAGMRASKKVTLVIPQQKKGMTLQRKQLSLITLGQSSPVTNQTASPLKAVVKVLQEQDMSLVVTASDSSKPSSAIKSTSTPVAKPSVPLHIANNMSQSTQKQQEAQQSAVKQLEMTVKRLEQELTDTKQMSQVKPINITQLTDQLYDQLEKKMKLERQRNGR